MKNKDAMALMKSYDGGGKVIIEIPKGDIQRIGSTGCTPVDCEYFEVDDISLCDNITVIRIGNPIK
jgi:hypothetical protein